MAQTGFTPIQLYRTSTPGATPSAANLAQGELAINIANTDMALFAENASGTVVRIMNNPAGLRYPTADGTNGQVLTTNGSGSLSFSSPGASLAGQTDTASPFETALGHQAGNVNTGANNTFIGYQAGLVNSTGSNNTALGRGALAANTTGTSNVAVGLLSLSSNTTASSNTAIGASALGATTTGNNNVGIGDSALAANVNGAANVAVGFRALDVNTSGSSNVAIGSNALGANTTGTDNVALGANTLISNTTANSNTAIGANALFSNTTGASNLAIGSSALANNTGSENVAVGRDAGGQITSGIRNTLLGTGAGASGTNNLTTGSNNIIIGYNAAPSSSTASDEVTLGSTSITSTRLRGMVELNAAMFEAATITATAATGTINYDARSQSVLFYTANASGNWTLNIRAAAGVSLDSVMTTGESMTVAFLVTQGATAFANIALQIDGSGGGITLRWQGGSAFPAGNANGIDAYIYTIIKTASATYTVLVSQTRFA